MTEVKINLVRKSISHWGMQLVDFNWIGWIELPTKHLSLTMMGEWGGPDNL